MESWPGPDLRVTEPQQPEAALREIQALLWRPSSGQSLRALGSADRAWETADKQKLLNVQERLVRPGLDSTKGSYIRKVAQWRREESLVEVATSDRPKNAGCAHRAQCTGSDNIF